MHLEVVELELLLTHVAGVDVLLVLLHVLLLVVNPCLVLVQHPLPTCLPCLLRWTPTLLDWHTSSLWGPLARWGRLTLELLRWLTLELLWRLALKLLLGYLSLELLRRLTLELLRRLSLELLRRWLTLELLLLWRLSLELLRWLPLELLGLSLALELLLLLILLWVDPRRVSLLTSNCVAQ
jgi:hypothetical protein